MAFGLWWLYLLFELGAQLDQVAESNLEYTKLIRMLELEGTTFVIVLFTGGIFASWVYLQDLKKSRSIQAFFSSLTHELKTPLASMRLQAEVIEDFLPESDDPKDKKLAVLIQRMIEDSQSLETQMDKALQLARLEQGGSFPLKPIELDSFFKRILNRYNETYKITLDLNHKELLADEFALELIFKNFLENTKRHQPQTENINITSVQNGNLIKLVYNDHGHAFKGDLSKLGQLFYKHNSSQGTGVGLYLTKRLASAMKGDLTIQSHPHLIFSINLRRVNEC